MSETIINPRRLRTGTVVLLALGIAALVGAFATQRTEVQALLLAAAVASLVIVIGMHGLLALGRILARRRLRIVMDFLQHDSAPGFCTDEEGAIFAQNRAALDRFGSQAQVTMSRALQTLFANPDAVVHRLRAAAQDGASAREDVVTRRGHVRLALHRIPGGYLWRLEDLVERAPRGGDGIGLPMLTFGSSGTILFMNEVLRSHLGRRAKRLRDVFEHVPLRNGFVNRLQTKNGWETVRVVLSGAVNGRQEVFVIPVGEAADGRVALDALPVALLRLDAEGRVVFANRPARDLLPAAAEQEEVRLAAMVEGLGRSVREWVSEAAAGRGLYRPEIVRVSAASTETFLQITLGRPLEDGDGGLIAVLNDATELKTMEAQFVQSQKMQAIGQLAGGVAHDFNNLLTAISGHCDLLLLRHREGDEDYADLTQITQNANRAAALVGQLLAFSRKQTLEMQQVDLRDTLGDLTHLLNRLVGERVQLRLDHDPALIPIRGDRRQLEQVLMNLVVNARDAMPDGGEIRIETECRYLDKPMTRDRVTVPAGQYVVVSVRDEGNGIPPDKLPRIFEPFFTTKRPGEGTGLGLSMAYGIVKQSGGYIFADSILGEGACFSLYFPADGDAGQVRSDQQPANSLDAPRLALRRPALVSVPKEDSLAATGFEDSVSLSPLTGSEQPDLATPLPEAKREAHAIGGVQGKADILSTEPAETLPTDIIARVVAETREGNNATDDEPSDRRQVVLLVEDEAPVRAFASRALRLRGYTVLEAACAEDALDVLTDQSLEIDLFVTDVMMPGMDGPSWVREALKDRPKVRTVFMSGYAQDALSETSQPVPNAVFLPKPFSLSDLTRTVDRALH
ncbi:ATP-binding protein [Jannaschia sp. M317]|uniref:ATP-binding response regulator n=1 Tax=Jannaschia sp. M317 TaxID=2867011 RepID=UPI0021A6D70A|nr:ATP-binding protein [Jannaschia sp. M317]